MASLREQAAKTVKGLSREDGTRLDKAARFGYGTADDRHIPTKAAARAIWDAHGRQIVAEWSESSRPLTGHAFAIAEFSDDPDLRAAARRWHDWNKTTPPPGGLLYDDERADAAAEAHAAWRAAEPPHLPTKTTRKRRTTS